MVRFWEKVDRSGSCWLWTAGTTWNGYGRFKLEGKTIRAHRFAWELENGPIPDGLLVLHDCDAPACVRPSHLWIGTNAENLADMRAKGRGNITGLLQFQSARQ